MEVPSLPDGTLSNPRFAHRHPLLRAKNKIIEDTASPTSVIGDMRFISPASSSSSSIDRRTLPETCQVKWQPRHDRGYSISDGEFSDPDTFVDSSGTSRELGKVGNSGPLESLPETHSLALEATSINVPEHSSGLMRGCKREDGEAYCRALFPASSTGSKSSDLVILSTAGRASDLENGEIYSSTRAPPTLRCEKDYQDSHDQAISMTITRSNSDAHTSSRGLQTPRSISTIEDEDHSQPSEWSQTTTSCESASEHDGKESSSSSTKTYTESESESQLKEQGFRTKHSVELSPDTPLPDRTDDTKRRLAAHGTYSGTMGAFGYPGTPLRFFPGWQAHLGSPPTGGHVTSGSPRLDKAAGSYSPANSLADMGRGVRFPTKFLSGPILGSMIPKPPPSKWDDAEKWIASPGHHESPTQPQHRPVQPLLPGRRHSIAGQGLRSYYGVGSPEYPGQFGEKPVSPKFEHEAVSAGSAGKPESLTHSASQKKRSKTLSFGDISRRFDLSRSAGKPLAKPEGSLQGERDGHGAETVICSSNGSQTVGSFAGASANNYTPESPMCMLARDARQSKPSEYCGSKTTGTPTTITLARQSSKHGRSASMMEISTNKSLPAALPEPSSHRDMGTQMTPIESLKNSTCTTPGFTTSPTRHNTPARSGRRSASLGALPGVDVLELKSYHLAKLELRKLAGDEQPTLDRNNVWSTREEEEMEISASLRPSALGHPEKRDLVVKATAWEDAELAKYTARYNKEETKIKVWEELQKAKAEAEMKKIEVKVERMRADANEKMMNRFSVVTKKAEEMRAAALAIRTAQTAKTAERADQMRTTGRLSPCVRSSSFRCCFKA